MFSYLETEKLQPLSAAVPQMQKHPLEHKYACQQYLHEMWPQMGEQRQRANKMSFLSFLKMEYEVIQMRL